MTLLSCSIYHEASILKFIFWSKLTAKYSSSHYPEEEEIEITKKRLSDAKNKMRSTICLTGISKEKGQGIIER